MNRCKYCNIVVEKRKSRYGYSACAECQKRRNAEKVKSKYKNQCKFCDNTGFIVHEIHDQHGGLVDWHEKKCHCQIKIDTEE